MQQHFIKIRGVLIPVEWDGTGRTTALAVATHEEEEYFINPTDTAGELFELLQEEVEIAGWYRQRGLKHTISPVSYRVIGAKNKHPTKGHPQTVAVKLKA